MAENIEKEGLRKAEATLATLNHLNSKFKIKIREINAELASLNLAYRQHSPVESTNWDDCCKVLQEELNILAELKQDIQKRTDDFNVNFGVADAKGVTEANNFLENNVEAFLQAKVDVERLKIKTKKPSGNCNS